MKRSAITSLSIAATFLAFSGSGFALGQSQSGQLTSGAALLGHSLDTKEAVAGQAVTAKLINPIDTAEGLTLPRGTELLGRVAEVQASHGKSAATLTLIFDKARTKDGKEVAIKATLVAIGPQNTLSDTSGTVATTDSFDQPAGELPGVSLHSVVQSDSSGTLTSKSANIRLDNGTEILIAVAPLTASGSDTASTGH
jgi:hypothetical protein